MGSDSLLNEVELIQIVDEVYRRLKLRVRLLINNRKVLAGIAEIIGYPEKLTDITVAIDKMDKIGIDNVNAELQEKGLTEEAILKLQPILNLEGDTKEKLQQLRTILQNSPTGLKGIEELTQVFSYLNEMPLQTEIKLDLTLARGLSYYTGAIFEVKALDAEMGSITGGGRYDDLTGIFGLKNVSGVGISFGADRIFDVMTQLDLFPEDANTTTRILFVNFGEKEECFCLPLLRQLRNEGINAEIYPEAAKMKKQMTYADRKKIPFVALVGENEIKEGTVSLKNMSTGEQANIKTDELAVHLK